MNTNFILRSLFLMLIMSSTSQFVFSQNKVQAESISQSYFIQLNSESKRVFFHTWVNKSQMIEMPEDFEIKAKDYYQSRENTNYYKKHKGILKVLFNEDIHVVDRVNFCNYLFELFSEDEMPFDLLKEEKVLLIQKMIKG